MTDLENKQRKTRKTYNIENHAHELTFSCYHQYDYLNDPKGNEYYKYVVKIDSPSYILTCKTIRKEK